MSLSSESRFMDYSEIRINGIRWDNPGLCTDFEPCVDFFVLYKKRNQNCEPGVHISIPLWMARKLANEIKETIKKYN